MCKIELVTLCKSYQADMCVCFINYTVDTVHDHITETTNHSLILNDAFGYRVVDPR